MVKKLNRIRKKLGNKGEVFKGYSHRVHRTHKTKKRCLKSKDIAIKLQTIKEKEAKEEIDNFEV